MYFREDLSYCVLKFQKGKFNRKELLKKLASFILKIPKSKGYYDEDLKYEFFLFIASKIDKILANYKEKNGINFEAWFFVVLSRQFYDFLSKTKWKIEKNENLLFLLEKNSFSLEDIDLFEDKREINFKYSFLTKREKEILSFKYGIVFENINNDDTKKIIMEKLEKYKRLERRLKKYQLKLLKIQSKLANETENYEKYRLIDSEKKIKKYRDRIIHIMDRANIFPSNSWVAKRLGISEGTVASLIYRIREKIKINYRKEFV